MHISSLFKKNCEYYRQECVINVYLQILQNDWYMIAVFWHALLIVSLQLESMFWTHIQIGQERERATNGLHRAGKTIWPSSPLQKSLIWRKLAGEWRGGSLAFEVQIPVEMDLICTYDTSLQQDGIMAEIWTLIWTISFLEFAQSVFWNFV